MSGDDRSIDTEERHASASERLAAARRRVEERGFQRPKVSQARQAIVVVWLAIGMATGWVAHERLVKPAVAPRPAFAQQAVDAHLVFARDMRHPVEVGAERPEQLFSWLSERLGVPVKAPSLQSLDYRLMGGRLLPAATGPAAQFMYENPKGGRLTLWVARAPAGGDASFHYLQADGAAGVWWADKTLAYALVGQADNQTLQQLASLAYEGLAAR